MKANSLWVVERWDGKRWKRVSCVYGSLRLGRDGLNAWRAIDPQQRHRLTRYVSTRKEATRG